MRRWVRAAVSFAIVSAAYAAYGRLIAPLIEYSEERPETPWVGAAPSSAELRADLQLLSVLFPAGSWELDNPKLLENDQFKLLIRDYRNLGEGRVELRPCTMVLLPNSDPEEDPADRLRRAVVLQAPHGALLSFDRPLNISRGDIGRLVAAQLIGTITIRGRGRLSGPEDDLEMTTRDVQMNEQQVWTPHPVEFRWGPHHGRGQQMRITLRRGERNGGRGPNIAGIELFELAHLENLHLELGDRATLNSNSSRTEPVATNAAPSGGNSAASAGRGFFRASPGQPIPIEITCRGPFRCDFVQQHVTLEDEVTVWRLNAEGPADQLRADSLLLRFSDRTASARGTLAATAAGGSPFQWEVQAIEAYGRPAVLDAPSESLDARGSKLVYEPQIQRITLGGAEEASIRQAGNEIRGFNLQYQAAAEGRIASARAEGPGWMRAHSERQGSESFEARWGKLLHLRPIEGNQVLSLTGGAELTYGRFGTLSGGEIHGWFVEKATPGRRGPQLIPDRMLARGQVSLRAEQLSGRVEQLEVWFEKASSPASGKAVAAPAPVAEPTGDGWEAAEGAEGAAPPTAVGPLRHIEFKAALLRARMLWAPDGRTEPDELLLEGDVQITEDAGEPARRALYVSGDQLHVIEALRPQAAVVVSGRPARIEGRGLGLTGENINLNRGTNRLWVDGSGWMDVQIERDVDGRPLTEPQQVRIDWRRQMNFDGRTARFEENVVAASATMNLRTETLDVQFDPPIRFADLPQTANPTIEQLLCRGGVLMENRTYIGAAQTTFDRLHVADLALNLKSGALSAGGPGWMSSVRRSDGQSPSVAPIFPSFGNMTTVGDSRRDPAPSEAREIGGGPPGAAGLWGIFVRFQGATSGNIRSRSLQFQRQVAAAFAPVTSWTAVLPIDQPELLGPDGFVMHCDELRVDQVVAPPGDRRALELTAQGNTVIEGDSFTGRAARMTYAEAKGLLVFEGDGRNYANLYQQKQPGGERSHVAARKILYWHKAGKLHIEGASSLETSGLSLPGRP